MNRLDVAYILLRFPCLTETFIAEEIRKIQSMGIRVHLYSLLPPKKEPVQSVSAGLVPQTRFTPQVYTPSLWWAQLCVLRKSPGQYFRLLGILLSQPAPELAAFPKRVMTFLKSIWLAKEIEGTPVKLLHSHFAWLSAAACMIVSELNGLPFTITAHAYDIYSKQSDILKLTTTRADRIVTISDYNKRVMLEMNTRLSKEKIEVIHCGIDLAYFSGINRATNNGILNITSVGSLLEKKGHAYLIRACQELRRQGIEFRCVIVGGGGLREQLQELIKELDLEDRVILVGPQTQAWVRDRLRESDVFVLACVVTEEGERDGIPVALMEATAMGVPVVCTSVSGIPELIEHEETGLLVPERDVDALAAAVSRLSMDGLLRQKLVGKGRRVVVAEFDINKSAAQLTGMFRRVTGLQGFDV